MGINHFLPPLKKGFQALPNWRAEDSRDRVGRHESEDPAPLPGDMTNAGVSQIALIFTDEDFVAQLPRQL